MMHSISRLGKVAQKYSYIEYWIYMHILVLWIKGCQLLRKFILNEAHHNPFGSGSVNDSAGIRHN